MTTNHFSQKVSQILAFSREEAIRMASDSVGPEHLLLGLLREQEGVIKNTFLKFDIDTQSVKHELEQRLQIDKTDYQTNIDNIVLNEKANNILKLAVLESRIQRSNVIDAQHLLLAILHDQTNNNAKNILESNNMNYPDTFEYLNQINKPVNPQNGLGLPEEDEEENEEYVSNSAGSNQGRTSQQAETATQTKQGKSKTPVLDNFGTDLTKAAMEGKLDPCVGREREIQRVTEILCRRKKNNPVLIGEPGVGKSAIVEGLAQLIVMRRTSPILFNKRVVTLDMTGVVAGTKYRGQFEERIKALIREMEQNPDVIIFIDEIHTMVGAGSAPGSMDAANILKPALARGTIQCIGATTLDEYRKSIEKDGALERRFQKVMVEPTTAEETLQILHNVKDRYEAHHHVSYTDEAILACVKLTDRYVTDRFFPDKAIDALDEVGSKVHLTHTEIPSSITEKEKAIGFIKEKKLAAVSNQNFEIAASYRDRQTVLEKELDDLLKAWQKGDTSTRETVSEEDVSEVVSMMSGVPVQRMAEAEGIRLKRMSGELKETVIGQDRAIDKVVKAIQRNRVGLKEPNHPIGVFMFLGPTGVGKTFLAKKLAEHMFGSDDALIRVDMSEYSEAFNTSRLVGAPPGYVGYDEGGQLTEKVRRKPYSIVLLDEIEKAHGNVFNMLLQVLDEGRLTDGNGRLIDFRNTIIILTSNAGTRQLKEFGRGVGFNASGSLGISTDEKDKEYARSIIQKSLSKQFSPEFLNRLDEIVTFDQLDIDSIKQIIDIELNGLNKRVENMGYHLELSEKAKEWLAVKGYDIQFGARPLKRAIQNYVEDGVCEMLLDNKLQQGDTIKVDKNTEQEELSFLVESLQQVTSGLADETTINTEN